MSKPEIIRPVAYYRAKRQSAQMIARGMSAHAAIGTLSLQHGFTILTNGSFSMIDAIRVVLLQTGPAHVLVTTWVPGTQEITDIEELRNEGQILSMKMILDYGFAANKPDRAKYLAECWPGMYVETRNHAKIATIQNDLWGFVLRGSLNLNGNFRCENLDGDNMPDFCKLLDDLFNELLDKSGSSLFTPSRKITSTYKEMMSNGESPSKSGKIVDPELAKLLAELG